LPWRKAACALKSGSKAIPAPHKAASRKASLLFADKGPVTGTITRS
jgi:hypothetical protein